MEFWDQAFCFLIFTVLYILVHRYISWSLLLFYNLKHSSPFICNVKITHADKMPRLLWLEWLQITVFGTTFVRYYYFSHIGLFYEEEWIRPWFLAKVLKYPTVAKKWIFDRIGFTNPDSNLKDNICFEMPNFGSDQICRIISVTLGLKGIQCLQWWSYPLSALFLLFFVIKLFSMPSLDGTGYVVMIGFTKWLKLPAADQYHTHFWIS